MKNSKDKHIQEKLDTKLQNTKLPNYVGEADDEKVYKLLYQELGKEPGYSLPPDFADNVVAKLKPGGLSQFLDPDHRPLFIGLIIILSLCSVALWIFKPNFNLSALSISSNMITTIILGIILLVAIQVADQRLLKPKIFKVLR